MHHAVQYAVTDLHAQTRTGPNWTRCVHRPKQREESECRRGLLRQKKTKEEEEEADEENMQQHLNLEQPRTIGIVACIPHPPFLILIPNPHIHYNLMPT
jgi:hypothetical protein